jgi:predicted permease
MTDLKFALRTLTKAPGFTTIAVLALALGIGMNTAIFSVVSGVLLNPLPYPDADKLFIVWETFKPSGWGSVSVPNLRDWREQNRVFEYLVAYGSTNRNLQGAGDPERLRVIEAQVELFDMLRVAPLSGRGFARGEDQPGAPHVAVISERLVKRRFASDPHLVGKTITLDGEAYSVVGIMPQGFDFPVDSQTELWLPLKFPASIVNSRGTHSYVVLGRLKPGITRENASDEMKSIAAQIEKQYPDAQEGRSVRLDLLTENVIGNSASRLQILLAAVGMVLLIACANIANLLLARATGRRQELAVRASLGASRGRIIRQCLTESLVLAALGGITGFLLAVWGRDVLVKLAAGNLPRASAIEMNTTVFLFLFAITLVAGVLFGVAPALRASRVNLVDGLKQGGRGGLGGARDHLRQGLVVAEIALAFVLLTGAGLLMRAFYEVSSTQIGIRTGNVLTFRVQLAGDRYETGESRLRFYDQLLEKIRALPGVRSAGTITRLPIQSWGTNGTFQIEGRPDSDVGSAPFAELRVVGTGYFQTLGIPLLRGRELRQNDSGVLLINNTLAQKYFPNEDPIGRRILRGDAATIVGVVGDVRQTGLEGKPLAELYYNDHDKNYMGWTRSMSVVVSALVASETLTQAVRKMVQEVDPGQPIFAVRSYERIVSDSLANRRLYLVLLGIFAGLALLLAMAGVYGVMSYVVALRSREFGLRVALGAEPGKLLRGILGEGLLTGVIGLAIGVAGALALTRFLQNLLYGVKPTDPLTFALAALAMLVVTVCACLAPAARAMRVDPMTALRDE